MRAGRKRFWETEGTLGLKRIFKKPRKWQRFLRGSKHRECLSAHIICPALGNVGTGGIPKEDGRGSSRRAVTAWLCGNGGRAFAGIGSKRSRRAVAVAACLLVLVSPAVTAKASAVPCGWEGERTAAVEAASSVFGRGMAEAAAESLATASGSGSVSMAAVEAASSVFGRGMAEAAAVESLATASGSGSACMAVVEAASSVLGQEGSLAGTAGDAQDDDYVDDLLGQVDFTELDGLIRDGLLGEMDPKISFSGLVAQFVAEGVWGFDYSLVAEWLFDAAFYEINADRALLAEAVLLVVGFSVLNNFIGAFRSPYVSDICFLMVYCVLGVMLLKSFAVLGGVVTEAIAGSVDFMKALVPVLSVTMVFSSGAGIGAGFYQFAFLVIYLIQWGFLELLAPLVQIYAIMGLLGHFFEDGKFENFTELLNGLICWGMKLACIAVLGLTAVQGLVLPARDRLTGRGISRAAAMIPGIGNALGGVWELLLGSGILIKNGVGAAALVFLVCISLIPMLKLACMALLYKLAAAVAEPVGDSRLVGCMKGMANGGVLYLKLMGYCLVMFFLMVALTTAMSGAAG